MIASRWLRSQLGTAWWRRLPDRHFRLTMTLLALCEEHTTTQVGGDSDRRVATHSDHRVVTRMADLVALCGASRATVRRMLLDLEQRGIVTVVTKSGRGSPILVILGQFLVQNVDSLFSPETGENSETCRSGVPPDPKSGEHFTETVQGRVIPLFPDAPARADLDLLRSQDQISDPRSGILRGELIIVPHENLSSFPPAEEWPKGCRDEDVERPAVKRTAADVAVIPDRAWAASDYLRSQVLTKYPACLLGRRQWDPGWTWTTGKPAAKTGDGSRSGLRLSWAQQFQQLHGKLYAAMHGAAPATTSDDAWTEISRTVHWLFHGQTSTGYRVDSPGSLIAKWDRIQDTRTGQKSRPAKGADNRPDPQASKKFERW